MRDFVCLLGALAGLCEALGAPRKVAFLLHRVCMALMEAKRWEAAHYAAALAAPCYHLSALQLAPPDRLHPLAYRRTEALRNLGGPPSDAGGPQDAGDASGGEGEDLSGFYRHSTSSLGALKAGKGGPPTKGGPPAGTAQGPPQDRSETPYFPVYLRQRHSRMPTSSSSSSKSSSSSRARGAFLTALWKLIIELQASGPPPDSLGGWGCCIPSSGIGAPMKGLAQGSGAGGPSLGAFLSKHVERLRFENNTVRVAWPALQSRVLHVLKVSAEQLGDFSRVAWYSFASLKLLYPVIDAKAQASAVMVVQVREKETETETGGNRGGDTLSAVSSSVLSLFLVPSSLLCLSLFVCLFFVSFSSWVPLSLSLSPSLSPPFLYFSLYEI